ncbi:hypothetical protein METHP14_410020 [Pseudomonas sp. P14-2025]
MALQANEDRDGAHDSKGVSGRERSLQNFAESALENQSRFYYAVSASRKMPPPPLYRARSCP